MIILGVDPGLTRCGVGVIEAGAYRRLSFIHVDVVRSDPETSQDLRLLAIYNGLVEKIERLLPMRCPSNECSRKKTVTRCWEPHRRQGWRCSLRRNAAFL